MKKRILCIEDDLVNSLVISKFLEDKYDSTVVRRVSEFLELAKENKYDVFLLDINLGPDQINGVELLQQIKIKYPNCKFIAVTAYALPGDEFKFIADGFDAYMPKPIIKEKLYELIESILVS